MRGYADHLPAADQETRMGRGLQVRNVNGVPTCLSKIDGSDPTCQPVDAFSVNSPVSDAVIIISTTDGSRRQQNDLQVINAIVRAGWRITGSKAHLPKAASALRSPANIANIATSRRG
jgi:hypothetical protein